MKTSKLAIVPIFFGFCIMGFVDVVGIATSYVKADFAKEISAEFLGMIPFATFLWFLVASVPTAVVMNKIGRKNTVLASAAITAFGMFVPFVQYNIYTCLAGFAFLGLGNTVIQVSLNPLMRNLVAADKFAGAVSFGQGVKAVSSFAGPFIALFCAAQWGSWQYIFPIFGATTIIFGTMLYFDKIPIESAEKTASISGTFALLGDKKILMLFCGIIAVVGIDVGINMDSSMILMERMGLDPTLESSVKRVALVPSVYFACRTIGAFLATAILAKMSASLYFKIHMALSVAILALMTVASSEISVICLVGAIGYSLSAIFSVIYALALDARPNRQNEISGLLITAICGGAIIPPIMTFCAGAFGSQNGAICVLIVAAAYLLAVAFKADAKKKHI